MWFGLVTLFPEILSAVQIGVVGRAIQQNLINVLAFNPRDYANNKHQTVDDKPYGGGPGMVMAAPPLKAAIEAAKAHCPEKPYTVYLSPHGTLFSQKLAKTFVNEKTALILVAGRYEGIDERTKSAIDAEWSLGDFILSGGELPALMVIDAIARLIPGVIGEADSIQQDSITTGLLKHPQYTRPAVVDGERVPAILTQGHHAKIERWRRKQALGQTWLRRPDLFEKLQLSLDDYTLLNEFIAESQNKGLE